MKKYEKTKFSGLDWMGLIPAHWVVMPIKHLTINHDNRRIPLNGEQRADKNGPYPYYGANGIVDNIDEFIFEGTYVLLGEDGAPFFIPNRDVAFMATGQFWVNNHAHILEARERILPELLCHQLNCVDYKQYISGSTRDKLTQTDLNRIPIIVPPLPEQRAIVAYLDHKTAQLDTLLLQKETLLQKLHQKRQALINEAVTEGLNPAAPRKASGVAWLGDVPAHWGVKALKYLLAEPMMYGANEAAELDDRSLPRYIRITDFGQEGKLRDETFKSLPYEVAKNYLLRNGDILFARSGATVGKTFFFNEYEGEACFAGYLIKGTFDTEKVLPEFVYLYTKSGLYDNWKNSIFIQSTIQNISAEKYKALLLAVPPISEQREIINWLEERYKPINEATAAIYTQIQTLKAYRQSLISEVVTGKMDVRPAVPAPEADLPLWQQ